MTREKVEPPEETVIAYCARCEKPFSLPAFINDFAKSWMARQWRDAERFKQTPPPSISRKELAVCGGCAEIDRVEKAAAEETDRRWRESYLSMLRSGVENPDAINWLRARGHGAEVDRILKRNEEVRQEEKNQKNKPRH